MLDQSGSGKLASMSPTWGLRIVYKLAPKAPSPTVDPPTTDEFEPWPDTAACPSCPGGQLPRP